MKRTILTTLIVSTLIIVGLSACKKETSSAVPPSGYPAVASPYTLNVVADEWATSGDGIYVNDIRGVLSNTSFTGTKNIDVYLEDTDEEMLINHAPVVYYGHELWATTTATDVIVYYRCPAYQPRPTLHLKILVH